MANLNDAGLRAAAFAVQKRIDTSIEGDCYSLARAAITAYLAALPPAGETGEPVAWQLVEPEPVGPTSCIYPRRPTVEGLGSPRSFIRPLYAAPVPAPQPPSEPERFTADDLRKMGEYKEGGYVAYSRDALRHVADLLDHPMRVRVSAAPPVVAREEDLANPITFEKWMDSGCPGQNSARHPPPAPPRPSAEAVAWLRNEATDGAHFCDKWSPRDVPKYAADILRFVEGR